MKKGSSKKVVSKKKPKITWQTEINDLLFLIQVVLLMMMINFFVFCLYVKELEVVFQLILTAILLIMGYSGHKRNRTYITGLYYIAGLCSIINIVLGYING